MVDYLRGHEKVLDDDSRRRLETNPLRVLDSKNPDLQAVIASAPTLQEYLDAESRAHFDTLRRLLDQGERDPEFLRLMLHSALEGHGLFRHFRARQVQPVFRFLRGFVEQRQREGVFAPGDPDVLTRALVAVPGHYVLQQRLFQMGGRSSDAAIDEQLTRFILSGLRAAPVSRRANRESDQP